MRQNVVFSCRARCPFLKKANPHQNIVMCIGGIPVSYNRHRPEETNLYRVIAENWQTFLQARAMENRDVPKFVVEEFEGYLRCGILAYGFGRLHCETCLVDRLVPFSCKGRGFCPSCGARKMAENAAFLVDSLLPVVPIRQFVVTFPMQLRLWMARSKELLATVCKKVVKCINQHLQRESDIPDGLTGSVVFVQRFGSAANLNVHLHIVAMDGVYEVKSTGRLKFYNAKAPSEESTTTLATSIVKIVNNYLIKTGRLEEREGITVLGDTDGLFDEGEALHLPAQSASVSHRIAFGPNAGQPVRRLRAGAHPWPSEDDIEVNSTACIATGGFSVHAATAVKAQEREKLERLVRYMARPAIADERIVIESPNSLRLKLKSAWKDGTSEIRFTPEELIEKLVALVPLPGQHTVRYYGVLASRSQHYKKLPETPVQESEASNKAEVAQGQGKKGKRRLSWADLLKRTFKVDVLACSKCKNPMKLVQVVIDSCTIKRTLEALGLQPQAPPVAAARSEDVFSFG